MQDLTANVQLDEPAIDSVFDNRVSRVVVGVLIMIIAVGIGVTLSEKGYALTSVLVMLAVLAIGTALAVIAPPPRNKRSIPAAEVAPIILTESRPATHHLEYARPRAARPRDPSPFGPLFLIAEIIGGFLWVPSIGVGIGVLQPGTAIGVFLILLLTLGPAITLLFTAFRGVSIGIFLAIMLLLLVIVICH